MSLNRDSREISQTLINDYIVYHPLSNILVPCNLGVYGSPRKRDRVSTRHSIEKEFSSLIVQLLLRFSQLDRFREVYLLYFSLSICGKGDISLSNKEF